ncbi:MAG: MBL fold metallo-hydrolase [Oscillospiraceae bacterium]|jgi:hydroxyacylglutathione hydrolase|nr:MBL fold metallo-hydrolase [Oscillospiraceae bacterium]
MQIQCISGGIVPTNCYLLTDDKTGQTAVIDPGFYDSRLQRAAAQTKVTKILLTHGHFDHTIGVSRLVKQTGAKVYLYETEADFVTNPSYSLSGMGMGDVPPYKPDVLLKDKDTIPLGSLTIQVLHTPGHTHGGCCYLVGDALFSGDTLMCGTVGRTDFPTGSFQDIVASVQRLRDLPGEWRVLPGHEMETKLSWERRNNPYMEADQNGFNS